MKRFETNNFAANRNGSVTIIFTKVLHFLSGLSPGLNQGILGNVGFAVSVNAFQRQFLVCCLLSVQLQGCVSVSRMLLCSLDGP